MNAIISLCHFCEVHGPKVLYSTQPFRPQEPKETMNADCGPASKSVRKLFGDTIPEPSSHSKVVCEGCHASQSDFVSHDVEAKVSFVSTPHISRPEVFTRIRQACLRSLSCEVCPGREGPIFFGDEQCGQVLSYTFYLHDTQARGLSRWYSIIVVMVDKVFLINSWPFLVRNIRLIIDSLQTKAKAVFDKEEAHCPQRSLRLRGTVDPTKFIQQRGGSSKTTRSLQDMTGDPNVYYTLHSAFIWLLHVCGNRTKETLLEGPPTQDSIVDMQHSHEETEEGFVMVNTRKVTEGDEEEAELDATDSDTTSPGPQGSIGSVPENIPGQNVNGPKIMTLRQLRKLLGGANFQTLAHHVVIGNQTVVISYETSLIHSIILLLMKLLPKGSRRHRHQFLPLSPDDVKTADDAIHPQHVVLEIKMKEEPSQSNLEDNLSEYDDENNQEVIQLDQLYSFCVRSSAILPGRVPSVLSRMIVTLCNTNLSEAVVESCFTCLKEEWMNKVKVHFTFTRKSKRSEDEMKKLLQMLSARDEDRSLLEFWTTGLSIQYRTHVNAALGHR